MVVNVDKIREYSADIGESLRKLDSAARESEGDCNRIELNISRFVPEEGANKTYQINARLNERWTYFSVRIDKELELSSYDAIYNRAGQLLKEEVFLDEKDNEELTGLLGKIAEAMR